MEMCPETLYWRVKSAIMNIRQNTCLGICSKYYHFILFKIAENKWKVIFIVACTYHFTAIQSPLLFRVKLSILQSTMKMTFDQ